jgi:hypothetical protein
MVRCGSTSRIEPCRCGTPWTDGATAKWFATRVWLGTSEKTRFWPLRSGPGQAPNGLSAGEVSCFGRHTLNTLPASQPQHPQSAPRPYPLERHPPPPRWSLHLTSRGGRDRKVSTTSRRLAGEIHDDASSSGGRPSGPRVRPDAPVARIAASSGKRGHAPATGDHFAGRPFRQRPWGPLPNVCRRHPSRCRRSVSPCRPLSDAYACLCATP